MRFFYTTPGKVAPSGLNPAATICTETILPGAPCTAHLVSSSENITYQERASTNIWCAPQPDNTLENAGFQTKASAPMLMKDLSNDSSPASLNIIIDRPGWAYLMPAGHEGINLQLKNNLLINFEYNNGEKQHLDEYVTVFIFWKSASWVMNSVHGAQFRVKNYYVNDIASFLGKVRNDNIIFYGCNKNASTERKLEKVFRNLSSDF